MNEGMNDATSAMSQHASPQEHSTYVLSTDKERFGSTQRHGWNRAWAWWHWAQGRPTSYETQQGKLISVSTPMAQALVWLGVSVPRNVGVQNEATYEIQAESVSCDDYGLRGYCWNNVVGYWVEFLVSRGHAYCRVSFKRVNSLS